MAELVGVFAGSHGPVIVRDWEKLPQGAKDQLSAGFEELGRRISAVEADLLIEIAPDHWVNFFMDNLPSICIGVGEEHDPPPEPFMKPFPFKDSLKGHPAFARHLVETAMKRGFEPSISHRLILDHGFCIPLWWSKLERLPPITPIVVNDLEPPMINTQRCVQWGRLLVEAIESYPEPLRVAVLATGGLSHSIGESTMGEIDAAFDKRFLDAMQRGDEAEIVETVEEDLRHTGNGAQEVRNWLIAYGAAGGAPFDLITYAPIKEVYVGCAFASWPLTAATPIGPSDRDAVLA